MQTRLRAAVASLAALLALLVPGLSLPAAPATAAPAPAPYSGTFIVGDSTLFRVAPRLRELEPDWYVDHQRGRSVSELPDRIASYLALNPTPSDFVMALGTNRSHPAWTYRRLQRAIAQLPAETNVYLLMVVRAGSFQQWKDRVLRHYNRFSRHLARERPHTYTIDWRDAVLSDPTLDPVTGHSSLLADGTHQTGATHGQPPGPGVNTWIGLVRDKVHEVNAQVSSQVTGD